MARLVTLTSDVGAAYAAQMKAVLARSIDPGRIVDLAHDLTPHAIGEAAFLVRAMCRGFPAGTIHVVVVDPGVGGDRAPVVIACRDGSALVGPDNGVLGPLAEALGIRQAFQIDAGRVARGPRVGTTFDGRDLFAPAAARLANGAAPSRLGAPHRPTVLRLPAAHPSRQGAEGTVVLVDRFGNLITNVPTEWVPRGSATLSASLGTTRTRIVPWVRSYEQLGPGRLGALGSSFGTVEIAVAEARADARTRARVGTRVRFAWARSPSSG